MSKSKTIFITGGSGYIGSRIITHAIADGYTVRALSRSEVSDQKLTSIGATPVRGNLESLDVLTAEAQADIVITLADAIADNYAIPMEERMRINNGAVFALAKGLEGTNKPLVFTSGSLYVGADPEGKEMDEASPPWETSPFHTPGGVEEHLLSLKEKGIRVCCVRLAPWVYGRGGSGVALFMNIFGAKGEMVYVGDGTSCTTTVDVDDAARLYLLVAEKGRSGEAYNATWETNVTFRALSEAMAKTLGVPVRSLSLDDAKASLGDFLGYFLSMSNRASNTKAKQELGWEIKAEKGILEEITTGSYVELAKQLQKAKA
jgi:nucleoside-diphosphate-sugar epimerase